MEIVRIPTQRMATLLGDRGATKKMLEKRCKVKLTVRAEGDVEINGEEADIYFAQEVVRAIGRGFEPRTALKVLKEDYQLYVIDLKEHAHTENAIHRIKGRVIGEEGRIKQEIEKAADSDLSVYGNTVAIIARIDSIEYAKEAIARLIHGAPHSSVLRYLASVRKQLMGARLGVIT